MFHPRRRMAAASFVATTILASAGFAQDADAPAVEEGPSVSEIYERAVTRYSRGGITAAYNDFKTVVSMDPTFAEAVYNVATIANDSDRVTDCAMYGRSFLALRPDDEEFDTVQRRVTRCERIIEERGTLAITSISPENTTFYVDGLYFGQFPTEPFIVPAGTHTVSSTRVDHEPFSVTVDVAPGQDVTVDIALTPVTYYGTVMFQVSEAGATILQDGEPAATSPMAEPFRLPVGRYLFTIQASGFHPWNRYIEVLRDGTDVVDVRLLDESIDLNDL